MIFAIVGTKHPLRKHYKKELHKIDASIVMVSPEEFESLPYRSPLPEGNFNVRALKLEVLLSYAEERKNRLALSVLREELDLLVTAKKQE